jgi:murein L,D-transpeptidase YcbB/YkuD
MKIGDSGPRIALLRGRLRALGHVLPETEDAAAFDSAVESAVAAFQRAIGLEADGVVGALTLSELNVTPTARIGQLRANLERWRWLPDDLGERHIRVNIAGFSLEARAGGQVEQVHDVIVGRIYRMTPVFSDAIRYVVLNPWWETPDSLARLDKLPLFQRDPDAVTRLGFEVWDKHGKRLQAEHIDWPAYSAADFPFRLRQQPGEQNALGKVKLMFPNRHNVYLHDTPTKDLFLKSSRAFSSGCVRVSGAMELTRWVLQETPEWHADKIAAALASGVETRANLVRPLPVHILYLTVVMDADGGLRFISDVYQRDQRLIRALANTAG